MIEGRNAHGLMIVKRSFLEWRNKKPSTFHPWVHFMVFFTVVVVCNKNLCLERQKIPSMARITHFHALVIRSNIRLNESTRQSLQTKSYLQESIVIPGRTVKSVKLITLLQ